jgi:hypothetical protein
MGCSNYKRRGRKKENWGEVIMQKEMGRVRGVIYRIWDNGINFLGF